MGWGVQDLGVAFPEVPVLGAGVSWDCCGRARGLRDPLTFGAEVQAFHVEDAAPQGNLLKDNPKAVHVTSLGAPGGGRGHS